MRADARKDYEALVAVARRHLSSDGVLTSLESIAREAGVGLDTLYRHFPDCDHLVFAALNAQGEELRAASAWICSSVADAEQFEWCLAEVGGLPRFIPGASGLGRQARSAGRKVRCRSPARRSSASPTGSSPRRGGAAARGSR